MEPDPELLGGGEKGGRTAGRRGAAAERWRLAAPLATVERAGTGGTSRQSKLRAADEKGARGFDFERNS
jgi:hypothetical protein